MANRQQIDALFRLGRLVRKELIEIIRDRRTIITLVLMPLLLYPLLSVAFLQFWWASRADSSRVIYRFGFASKQEADVFFRLLSQGQKLLEPAAAAQPGETPDPARPEVKAFAVEDLEESLREGKVDVGVRLNYPDWSDLIRNRAALLDGDILFVKSNPVALGALAYVERRLTAVHEHNLESRLGTPGDQGKVSLLRLNRTVVPVVGAETMDYLAGLIPLILILMTITGAVYPAIDLTAGERERGTLEILVAAPVPRLGLLFAKYVSVFSVAVLTALVNLVAMVLTLIFSGLSQELFKGAGLTPLLVVQLFGLLLLFAAFFSAVLLSLTSFARSFKEAQAYLIPLMLASLGPGLIGMMPGLDLKGPLAAAPLVNIVLLARDLVKGVADPAWALVVILTTLTYAAAAIALAARIFGAEGVLYNEQSGWSDLFRRPSEPQPAATVSSALWCLALMIPSYFAFQWLVRPTDIRSLSVWHLGADAVVGLILFGVFPLISAYFGRVRMTSGFGVSAASPAGFMGGALLGVSLWPLLLALLTLLPRTDADREMVLIQIFKDFPRIAIANVVLHALVEEFFFRGYLFGALRGHFSKAATIGIAALLFGSWHLVLGWKQFLPSTLMGLALGWVRWNTGSVLPGMLLHACHNAILVGLAIYGPAAEMETVPWTWVAAGAAGTSVGAALVWWGKRTFVTQSQSDSSPSIAQAVPDASSKTP